MIVQLMYLVAAICFILALKGLSSPKYARYGNFIGAFGMLVAVVTAYVHGVVVVGVMVLAASTHTTAGYVVVFVAAAFAAMNVVGGYVVTDRMLEMFHARRAPVKEEQP